MLKNGAKLEEVLVSAFVAVEGAYAFSAFLPSIFTIRHFGADQSTERDIRDGEIAGALFALSLGALVGLLIKSPLPLIFSVGTSGAMISVYEYALRSRYQLEAA